MSDDLKGDNWEVKKGEHEHHHEHHEEHQQHHEAHHHEEHHAKKGGLLYWQIATAVLVILLAVSVYSKGFSTFSLGSSTPAESGFSFIVLNDQRCAECDTTGLVGQLKQIFPNATVKNIDYSSKEGKALYDKLTLTALPAVLFTDAVKTEAGYPSVQSFLEQKGTLLSLKIGASFNPNAEICNNGIDDNGDGTIDCADPTCSTSYQCMAKQDKPTADLFVWAFCPGGISGENTLKPVVDILGNKIDAKVKFIGPVTTDPARAASSCFSGRGLDQAKALAACCETYKLDGKDLYSCALHNQPGNHEESIESARQACIMDNYDYKAYWAYLTEYDAGCVSQSSDKAKYTACYETAMKNAGIDKAKIATCLTTSAPLKHLIADSDKSETLAISASPTLYINGVEYSGQRTPEAFKEGVCLGFKTAPVSCNQTAGTAAATDSNVKCGS